MSVKTELRTQLRLTFRPDIKFSTNGNGSGRLQGEMFDLPFRKLSAGLKAAMATMSNGGATSEALKNTVSQHDGPMATMYLHQYLSKLASIVCHTLYVEDQKIATLIPLVFPSPFRFHADLAQAEGTYKLSRFSYIRRENDQVVLENPQGYAKVVLHDEKTMALIHHLYAPATASQLAEKQNDFDGAATLAFLNLLANGSALHNNAEDDDPTLAQWDFHDLLFHSRSRMGRHNYPYGGTFRSAGKWDPLPPVKEPMSDNPIELYKSEGAEQSHSLAQVMGQRRSIRDYDDAPISAQQLGEFLYRVGRVKGVFQAGPQDQGGSMRPYPAGGSIYELDIYPIIGQCDGLASGLYHYEPLNHNLHQLAEKTADVNNLLQMAWYTADRRSKPQICLAITARFQRVQWKYESMVYALILKHVGVLYQTMYLVATDMGLAPCALGGGHSDMFAKASGLNYYAESTVGEFLLGKPAASTGKDS